MKSALELNRKLQKELKTAIKLFRQAKKHLRKHQIFYNAYKYRIDDIINDIQDEIKRLKRVEKGLIRKYGK